MSKGTKSLSLWERDTLLSYSPRPALTAPATSARARAPSAKDAHNMYQNSSDALEILTDHAEIQASIFRGAIAEKKELRDFRRVL